MPYEDQVLWLVCHAKQLFRLLSPIPCIFFSSKPKVNFPLTQMSCIFLLVLRHLRQTDKKKELFFFFSSGGSTMLRYSEQWLGKHIDIFYWLSEISNYFHQNFSFRQDFWCVIHKVPPKLPYSELTLKYICNIFFWYSLWVLFCYSLWMLLLTL